jgi:TolB-like protein
MSQDKAAGQPAREMAMSLTAEQRRALAMLTHAGLNGASQASLMAHGFCTSMIAGLVKRGLATVTREKVPAGGRLVDVGKVRITAAGRHALTAERWRSTLRARPPRVPEQDLHR